MSLISQEEINLLNTDSKYKNYVSSIEKSLKNFESSTEWADLISSLGKLKKVLQSCQQYQFIPKRVSVCKRLAQCLHPALPSGVHLKALEVYKVIFKNIGTENLSKDLFLYASGLFPLLANAALSVKPILLEIYDSHFLPLKQALRPCLTGLILGILPGLEEGSDFYNQTFNLLKNICIAQSDSKSSDNNNVTFADDKYFYTCLWSAIVSQSSIRFPAIQFILTNYEMRKRANMAASLNDKNNNTKISNNVSKNKSDNNDIEDQLYLIGGSIDLMINGICCCLQDSNTLVQRSILDLICLCLPINTRQITKGDKIQLIVVAIHVVLRRDMSLNRRIYSWLMGSTNVQPANSAINTNNQIPNNQISSTSGSNSSSNSSELNINDQVMDDNYFNTHSKNLLIHSIKLLLNKKESSSILYLLNEDPLMNVSSAANNVPGSSGTVNSSFTTTSSNTTTTLKIIKIVSNLVERQEIGQSIIDDILLDLLFYVYKECNTLLLHSGINNSNYKKIQANGGAHISSSNNYQQYVKELDELKKATCNFLFQSFQLYFIWDFCANKFEKICKSSSITHSLNRTGFIDIQDQSNGPSPAQLCDLYEFILDLLTNAEIYNEIQTEHLPVMLKRIIQTLNTYCSKMSNQDLSKSLLLCQKILKKVVPKITLPESKTQNKTKINQSSSRNRRSLNQSQSDDPLASVDTIVKDVLDNLISTIESEIEIENDNDENDLIIKNCVFYLKQLIHKFIKSHLFYFESSPPRAGSSQPLAEDYINRSFSSIFHSNNLRSFSDNSILFALNNDNNNNNNLNSSSNSDNDTQDQLYFIDMKPSCLSYLQSFQILNRLLIKILFFPREKSINQLRNSMDDLQDNDVFLLDTFEEWLKDLFVISCSSRLDTSHKLFEFKSISINTIIQLIHLSESVNSHYDNSDSGNLRAANLLKTIQQNYFSNNLQLDKPATSFLLPQSTSSNTSNSTSSKNICLIQSIFTQKQINLIYHKSNFGHLIAKMLWDNLSSSREQQSNATSGNFTSFLNSLNNPNSSANDRRAAILFCLLHETLPTNLCEDIIAQNLLISTDKPINAHAVSRQIDAVKRFIRLWHWSREVNDQDSGKYQNDEINTLDDYDMNSANFSTKLGKSTKTFERSLLIIFDMLSNKSLPTTLTRLIQEWLMSCICEYNDLSRLLDVLLVSLLHPTTSRVSIQFYLNNIVAASSSSLGVPALNDEDQYNTNLDSNYESKITAVSSESGNVKYHLNNSNRQSLGSSNHSDKPLFLLTSLNDQQPLSNNASSSSANTTTISANTTRPLRNTNVELPLSILNAASLANQGSGISLRINPFLVAKNVQNSGNSSNSTNGLNSNGNGNESSNFEDYDDEYDQLDNAAKNARLLQNYKAIKAAKEKEKSKSLPSPSKNDILRVEQATPSSVDNSTFIKQFYTDNHQNDEDSDFDDDDQDDDDQDDDDDDPEDHDRDDDDDDDYDNEEDSRSQTTELTLLNSQHLSTSSISSNPNHETDSLPDAKKRKPKIESSPNKKEMNQRKAKTLDGMISSSPALKKKSCSLSNTTDAIKNKSSSLSVKHITNKPITPRNTLQSRPVQPTKELIIDTQNPLDPNFSHILIYSNCNNMQTYFQADNKLVVSSFTNSAYDHVRTLFVFRCIEQILDKCTKEFLVAIATTYLTNNNNVSFNSSTSSASSFSVHNEKLLDLIVRHLKSLYGNSFYSSSADSNQQQFINFNLNTTTYLEAITLILLFYIRSYYAPSKITLQTPYNIKSNIMTKSVSSSSLQSTMNGYSATSTSSSSSSGTKTSSSTLNSSTTNSSTTTSSYKGYDEPDFGFEFENINNDEELFNENRNVQTYALKILSKIIKQLKYVSGQFGVLNKVNHFCSNISSNTVGSSFSNLVNFDWFQSILDLMERCKLQKTLLHCFFSTTSIPVQNTIAHCVLSPPDTDFKRQIQYTYVCELINSLENLIELERILNEYQLIIKMHRQQQPLINSSLGSSSRFSADHQFGNVNSTANSSTDDDFLLTLSKKAVASIQISMNSKKYISTTTITTNSNVNLSSNITTLNLSSLQSTRYIQSQSICNQAMFISSILHYLKQMTLVDYHLPVLKLVRSSLPSAGKSLVSINNYVIEQICRNLLYITNGAGLNSSSSSSGYNHLIPMIAYMSAVSASINIPDILIYMLKELSYLINYCLLNYHSPSLSLTLMSNELGINLFNNNATSEMQVKLCKQYQIENDLNQSQARDRLVHLLPSILSSMVQVWQRCNILLNSNSGGVVLFDSNINQEQSQPQQNSWILGHPLTIKKCITDMLNPIANHHGASLMIAIGNVWGEKRKKSRIFQDHKVIIELVRSLKSFPISTIVQNITEILKQSNQNSNKDKKKSPINVWLLQFLHSYLDSQNQSISTDVASCLCNFFKDSLSFSSAYNFAPACYFQLFRILHDSVNNFQILVDDKRYSKEIQDSTHKLFEMCNSIVASSLQQTTWLRKNYAVKLTPQQNNQLATSGSTVIPVGAGPSVGGTIAVHNDISSPSQSSSTSGISSASSSDQKTRSSNGNTPEVGNTISSDVENEAASGLSDTAANLNSIDNINIIGDLNDAANNLTYSLQALNILAEYLAKTLDIVYKSDEKDRLVVPLLINLMSNLWPYLKTHNVANKNNFRAASHLLMSLTQYPYTRKTWKKEVFEMLFDNSYFHVDAATLDYSKIIIDNLISNDRAMFKDVLTRVTYQQSASLFTSKEQESEQKAQLLKRLAFVIYSSEKDQYQKNMPEIQECIAHILKLVQSANLYSTLFLLFRILLLRISSRHLIALWPTILSELVVILLQIEQDLNEDLETKNGVKNTYLDHIANTNNSFQQSISVKLQIYLSACKLIDLILTLPSTITSQFQLYKWSFINTDDALNLKQKQQFVPYLIKINNLLKFKYPNHKSASFKPVNGPLIRHRQIQSLVELKSFFEIVTTHAFVHNSNQTHLISNANQQNNSILSSTNLKAFEASVHEDFLEGWIS